jgi:UDP-glucose 4-epimerase
MKRVLITGASGFIGSYLVKHLTGYDIRTLSLREPNWQTQPLDCDVIIHCAGIAHATTHIDDSIYQEVNCNYTATLFNLAMESKVDHFIFLSSALVYGEGHVGQIDEKVRPNPQNAYAKSKVCAEEAIQNSSQISTLILRLPLVIGEHAKGNVQSLARIARLVPFFPTIKNQRSVLNLSTLVEVIEEAIATKASGVLHPRSQTLSTSELYQSLRKQPTWVVPFPQGVFRFLRQHSRFFAKLAGDFYYKEELQ